MMPTETLPNPYVGPRAFRTDERAWFFGRAREIFELTNLLLAERVVFLTAPSGAGKTSLIQAGLIPGLGERFQILPIARLNAPGAPPGSNRYLFSALQTLSGGCPPTDLSLETFLRARAKPEAEATPPGRGPAKKLPRPLLLVFDQFEEALTLDPYDRAAKEQFFAGLSRALRRDLDPAEPGLRPRWALFALRDEYYAAFTPYLRLLPPGLGVSYRLDLLDERAARDAAVKPALLAGLGFAGDPGKEPTDREAAVLLANNLRRVRSPLTPGETLSPYVEPALLQVVCHRLWGKITGEGGGRREITAADVTDPGLVDNALAEFYSTKVAEVAGQLGGGGTGAAPAAGSARPPDEWAIRLWFERRLINERGFRGLVVQGSREFEELGERAVRLLVNSYLVREDVRPASVLYELVHDCLIEPILRDNKPWREIHQGLLQVRARVWEDKGAPKDAYLLSESELREAEAWAEANRALMGRRDRDYLAACQAYHREREQKRVRKQRITNTLIVCISAAVVGLLITLCYFLVQANRRLDRLGSVLEDRQAMATALEQIPADPGSALGAARPPFKALHDLTNPGQWPGGQVPDEAVQAERRGFDIIHRALHALRVRETWKGHEKDVNAVACDCSGHRLASAGGDGMVLVRDAASGAVLHSCRHESEVVAVAFDPKHEDRLATATSRGAFLWTLPGGRDGTPQARKLTDADLNAVAIDPPGRRVAAAGDDGWVQVWTVPEEGDKTPSLVGKYRHGESAKVYGLAFGGPAGWLASAGSGGTVKLWEARAADEQPVRTFPAGPGPHSGYRGVAFSPDGRRLATAAEDGTAEVWGLEAADARRPQRILYASPHRVNAVAFSKDGELLATAGRDRLVKVWDVTAKEVGTLPCEGTKDAALPIESRVPLAVLVGHTHIVTGVAFSPTGPCLASSSDDRTVKLWYVSGERNCFVPIALRGRTARRVALAPSGEKFAASWYSTTGEGVYVWDVGSDAPSWKIEEKRVTALAFSGDSRRLATGSEDGKVKVWDVVQKQPTPFEGKLREDQTVNDIAFDPKGRWLAACTGCRREEGRSELALWDLDSPAAPPRERAHPKIIIGAAFDGTGSRVATACNDHKARVWTIPDISLLPDEYESENGGEAGTCYGVAFIPDGDRLAAACADGATRVWKLQWPEARKAPRVLRGHEQGARCVAFDPARKWLATGGYDMAVRIWDLGGSQEGDRPLYTLSGPTKTISELHFVGRRLGVVSFDGSVRFYDLDYESLLPRIDARIKDAGLDPGGHGPP
jgi:WD40 repeat protein